MITEFQQSFSDLPDAGFTEGSVFGYREWGFMSAHRDSGPSYMWGTRGKVWVSSVFHALCEFEGLHDAPDSSCGCGVYAFWVCFRSDGYSVYSPLVGGVIEGYGKVLIGSKGFRCEYARIRALHQYTENGANLDSLAADEQFLAETYGVPVFSSVEEMLEKFPLTTGYSDDY